MPGADPRTVSPVAMPVVLRRSATTCTRVKAWGRELTARMHQSVEEAERTRPCDLNGRRRNRRPGGGRASAPDEGLGSMREDGVSRRTWI